MANGDAVEDFFFYNLRCKLDEKGYFAGAPSLKSRVKSLLSLESMAENFDITGIISVIESPEVQEKTKGYAIVCGLEAVQKRRFMSTNDIVSSMKLARAYWEVVQTERTGIAARYAKTHLEELLVLLKERLAPLANSDGKNDMASLAKELMAKKGPRTGLKPGNEMKLLPSRGI